MSKCNTVAAESATATPPAPDFDAERERVESEQRCEAQQSRLALEFRGVAQADLADFESISMLAGCLKDSLLTPEGHQHLYRRVAVLMSTIQAISDMAIERIYDTMACVDPGEFSDDEKLQARRRAAANDAHEQGRF